MSRILLSIRKILAVAHMGPRDWGSLSLSIAKGPAKLKAGGPKGSDWGYNTVYDVCCFF